VGFSPFELVCGRRGPLDFLKETWELSPKSPESVVLHILMMQEHLAELQELVRINMEQSQTTQKTWYDQNARKREFLPGDQVLILLPTITNKLLAEWQRPYPITRRIREVNYEVRMTDRRKQKRIFHINMLRAWHFPTAISCSADDITDATDEEVTYLEQDSDGKHGGTLGLSPMDVRGSAGTTPPHDIHARTSFGCTPSPPRGRGRGRGLRKREPAGPGFVGTTAEADISPVTPTTIGERSFDPRCDPT
jgi:hypothetical protein